MVEIETSKRRIDTPDNEDTHQALNDGSTTGVVDETDRHQTAVCECELIGAGVGGGVAGANMPRYYFDIFNDLVTIDDTGVELPDRAAAREEVRRSLPAMLKELKAGREASQLRVEVRNEAGERVVTASVLMVIQCVENRREGLPES